MKIYNSFGAEIFDVEINKGTKLKKGLGGIDIINAVFTAKDYFDLKLGDNVSWRGVKYTMMDEPSVNKKRMNEYHYNIDFKAPKYQFSKAIVLLDEKTEFFIYGNLATMLAEIVSNINRVLGNEFAVIGNVPDTDVKNVQFANIDGLTAIDDVVGLWEYEWYVQGSFIHVVDKIGDESTRHEFQFKKGLKTIERKKLRENELCTRLYAMGSEKNVNVDYGYKRLRIPPIEENVEAFGVIEKTKIWEDVFPSREGTIKSIGDDVFTFSDSAMDFDLNENLIGIPAKVSFNTGDLQGYEFELISYVTSTRTFKLQEYSDETGLTLPNDEFFPKVDDVFILHDIKLPDVYYRNAESVLSTRAEEFMLTASLPTVEYEVKPDITNLRENNVVLDIGDVVVIRDSTLGVDIETRITELTQSIVEPFEYVFRVGNKTGDGFVREISSRTSVIGNTVRAGFNDTYVQINHLKAKTITKEQLPEDDGLIGNNLLKEETKGLPYMSVGLTVYPNYADVANDVFFEDSTFHHFTIQAEKKVWSIEGVLRHMTNDLETYFVYVQCEKLGASGLYNVTTEKLITESGSDYYYFLIGALSPISEIGERKFTSLFTGSGIQSVNNLTIIQGGTDSPEIIAEKYHSVDDVNQLTDVLYQKLVDMQQTANVMTLAFQTPLRIKASGNTVMETTEKNDVVLMRFVDNRIFWAIYSGTGDLLDPLSYRLIERKDLTLYP